MYSYGGRIDNIELINYFWAKFKEGCIQHNLQRGIVLAKFIKIKTFLIIMYEESSINLRKIPLATCSLQQMQTDG